jgi:hypothetical protein
VLGCKRLLVLQPYYFRTVLDEKGFSFNLIRLLLVYLVISVSFEQRSLGARGVEMVCSR